MEQLKSTEVDFRKWISFNSVICDFQNLYDLYNAVDKKRNMGDVSFTETSIDGESAYLIEQKGVTFPLALKGETNRSKFLEYVIQHYFPNQEIEEWYKSKLEAKNKQLNHFTGSPASAEIFQDLFQKTKSIPKNPDIIISEFSLAVYFMLLL